jgi:hypothetical protein
MNSRSSTKSRAKCPTLAVLSDQRQRLINWVATPGRSGATACGCGSPCKGKGALPGLAISAPEQPTLCAPIVSHTCAATYKSRPAAHPVLGRMAENSMPVMSAARPLFPRKRTSIRDLAMSHSCQEATYAPQQTASLFDQLVGAQQERFRDREAERLGSR